MFGRSTRWLGVGLTLSVFFAWSGADRVWGQEAPKPRDPRETVDNLQKALEKLNQSLQARQKLLGGLPGLGPLPGMQFQQPLPINPRLGSPLLRARENPRLGAVLDRLDPALVEQLDLAKDQGLLVRAVRAGGAAARAGLKTNDILWELNGRKVPSADNAFARLLESIKPQQPVDAVILRKGKHETIKGLTFPEVKAVALNPRFNVNPVQPRPGKKVKTLPAKEGLDIQKAADGAFTTRYKEEQLLITIQGKTVDGKTQANHIQIRDGNAVTTYASVEQVPEEYRRYVEYLVRLTEKQK